jgi:hypothetical protein
VAPLSQNETNAVSDASSLQSEYAPYESAASANWNDPNVQSQYTSPYNNLITNPALQNLTNSYNTTLGTEKANAPMQDAWGVGGSAATEAATTADYNTEYGTLQAQGNQAAYGAGLSQFEADKSRMAGVGLGIEQTGSQAIGAEQATGMNQRSIAQAQDTAGYNQYLTGQGWSAQQLGLFNQIMSGGAGADEDTSSVNPGQEAGEVLGAAASIASFF